MGDSGIGKADGLGETGGQERRVDTGDMGIGETMGGGRRDIGIGNKVCISIKRNLNGHYTA